LTTDDPVVRLFGKEPCCTSLGGHELETRESSFARRMFLTICISVQQTHTREYTTIAFVGMPNWMVSQNCRAPNNRFVDLSAHVVRFANGSSRTSATHPLIACFAGDGSQPKQKHKLVCDNGVVRGTWGVGVPHALPTLAPFVQAVGVRLCW
jgi:hypothetical protein